MHNLKRVWTYLVIVAVAMLAALNYELFVFPNSFAPSGLNGICTIIQYVSGISVGYMSLLINIPLALLVFFKVSKPVAVRSMVYVVVFSVGLLILDKVDLSAIAYSTQNGTSRILGPHHHGLCVCHSHEGQRLYRRHGFCGGHYSQQVPGEERVRPELHYECHGGRGQLLRV